LVRLSAHVFQHKTGAGKGLLEKLSDVLTILGKVGGKRFLSSLPQRNQSKCNWQLVIGMGFILRINT